MKYPHHFRASLTSLLLQILMCSAVLLSADSAMSKEQAPSLTKEELLSKLKTRQAQLALDQARTEMESAKTDHEQTTRLFDEKVVAIDELNKTRQAHERAVLKYEQAKIDLERTRLEFLKGATLMTVVDAKKYRGKEGEVMVSITLRNDSDLAKARIAMEGDESISDDELQALLKIDNVIVSLRDRSYSIIGDPYQRILPKLEYATEATLEYKLLKRDAEDVAISVEYLETRKDYNVFLKKEALHDLPTIRSTQYAQQGQLGTKIRYDLELERLAKTEQSFSLIVLNLPTAFSFSFRDPKSGAQITQIKFTSDISKQNLDFEVSIPEKLQDSLVDVNISFYILITRQAAMKDVFDLTRKHEGEDIPVEEIATLTGEKVNLILIPKGTPQLEMKVANLYKEAQLGESVELKYYIVNSGTLALSGVTPEIDLPIDWRSELEPRDIALIEPGEEKLVTASITPPEDMAVGEYTLVLKCTGHSGVDVQSADEKDFKLRIAPKTNVTGTLLLVAVLIGLVLAIAIASVKISRR
jgi:hypothetical protein